VAARAVHIARRNAVGRVLVAVVVIVLVGLSGLAFVLYEQTSIKPSTVSLSLDFTPNPGDAPLFYGVAQGIYKQNHINLTIIPGTSVNAAIASLEAGDVNFALVAPSSVVDYVAKNNVTNIQMVAMEYARGTLVVIYNNASISTISDLNGKSGSMVSPSAGDVMGDFQLFANANGLNTSSMSIQYNPVSTSDDLLLTGKVQFIVASVQNLATVQSAGSTSGLKFGYFAMSDNGFNSAGFAIATTESMIQQNPGVVRDFVEATMQSLVSAYANQTGAVADLVSANPDLNETASLQGYRTLLSCCSMNPGNLTNPLQYGWINPQFMQQTVNNEIIADNLGITLNATTIYTNEFVQQP